MEAGLLLLLLSACLRYTSTLGSVLDIKLYDETTYLSKSPALNDGTWPEADMAPLYSGWYALLGLFAPDPVDLFMLGQHLASILPCLAVYVFLRAARTGPLPAVIVALLVLVSRASVPLYPKVSHVTLAVILATLAAIARARSGSRAVAWGVIGASVMAYVRPEFTLSAALFAVPLVLGAAAKARDRDVAGVGRMLAPLLVPALLLGSFGNPLLGGRGMIAFGQHYALNKVRASHGSVDPWTNWESLVEEDFGQVSGIGEALRAKPSLFMGHVATNLQEAPLRALRIIVPAPLPPTLGWIAAVLGACSVMVLLHGRRPHRWRKHGRMLPMASAVLLLPVLLSVAVIGARPHYLVFPVVVCLSLFCVLASRGPTGIWNTLAALAVMALFTIVVPPYGTGAEPVRPSLMTVERIRSLDLREGFVLLDADGGYGTYLPDAGRTVDAQSKTGTFSDLLRDEGIGLIVVSDRLREDHRYALDSTWAEFLSGGYHPDFVRIPVDGAGRELFVARHSLEHGGTGTGR